MNIKLLQSINCFFDSKDLNGAASHLESLLRDHDFNRFTSLADKRFTNSPQLVLMHINRFIEKCGKQFDVEAIYVEMNGFDTNFDLWYFDSFGYSKYDNNPDELEWLCDWDSPDWPQFTLTGLEDIQKDYSWFMENNGYMKEEYMALKELADLLVMVRFVQLIGAAIDSGKLVKSVPVLATAHEFDIHCRFLP